MTVCTATSKQSGKQCRRHATPGRGTCAIHGGKTPAGVASPHFRTGRYSKAVPHGLLARYEASLNDPELLALRDDVAILQGRQLTVLQSLRDGSGDGELWAELKIAAGELKHAIDLEDADREAVATERLLTLIEAGGTIGPLWDEFTRLAGEKVKLITQERKRLIDLRHYLPIGDAVSLVEALTNAVKAHVSDPNALAAIASDLQSILATTCADRQYDY